MRVIDLSKPLYSGMDVYPGDPTVQIKVKHQHENEGWELRDIQMGSHTGTHVDAFSHMHPQKASLDKIPLDRFFGDAQVVQKSDKWPSTIGLFFTEAIGLEVLERLLEVKPNFVGGDINEELERALLKAEIVTYTNLVNLEEIPLRTTFTFVGLPLKIQEGDGSPVRAIAILNQ